MKELGVDTDMLESSQITPKGHQQTSRHLTFDAKTSFTWHKNKLPNGSTRAGVVSKESERISFASAALNSVHVL